MHMKLTIKWVRKLGLALLLSVFTMASSSYGLTLKIASVAPEGTTWMKEIRAGAKQVETLTQGRVKFKFYPGGVMGSYETILRKIRVGQLHGGAFTGGELSKQYPDANLYSLPFLFENYAEVHHIRSQFDESLAEGFERSGFVALGLSGGGFVYLMSNQAFNTIEELKQLKVWIPEGDPVARAAFEAAGVSPVSLPIADVYTGLQTGLINTVVNTAFGAIAFQWHTKIKYVLDYPMAFVTGIFALDNRSFGKISEADQSIVKETMASVFRSLDQLNEKDNIGARAALKNQGIEFVKPEAAEIVRWQAIGDTVRQQMGAGTMTAELIQAVGDSLDEFSN